MSYVTHTASRGPRRARLAAGALLVALAAVTLVWIGRASAQEAIAATRSISTQIPKADAVQTDIAACNDQPGFVNMPEMLVSFKIAGTAARAVIVLFEGEWFSNDGSRRSHAVPTTHRDRDTRLQLRDQRTRARKPRRQNPMAGGRRSVLRR
jgi:hypothetical protein